MSNGNTKKNAPTPNPGGPAKPVETKTAAAGPAKGPVNPIPPPAPPPLYRPIDWLTFGLTFLVVFAGYLWTVAPDLTLEDCGELAVGSYYAGVPHPPGYPVWTIYSWFFTLLPISNIAYRVAISSAFAGALSCGLVGLMVSRGSSMMIEGIAELKNIERRWESAICIVAGFVAGMLLGFNGFMWSQSVIVEVYTLSVLSLSLVLICLMRWLYAPFQHRYLYWAFFWFGICFNNHQSLLVTAMGLEVAIMVVQPRLGRELLFWNVILYAGGLVGKASGLISTLNDNGPLMFIYHAVGLASAITWIWLLFKTKPDKMEMLRNLALIFSLGYLVVLFGHITNYFTKFYVNDDLYTLRTGVFVLFHLVGLGAIGTLVYLARETRAFGREWLYALGCGSAWIVGAAFYVYMPLASMSNPPLNWGYPRTVTGFFHAFTRGQYERIHPTPDLITYFKQFYYTLIEGTLDEFNLIFILIGIIIFFFYKKMQPRERAWVVSLSAIYLCLGPFLMWLLSPAPDRQSQDLNKVFFTASHVMISMFIGYGVTLIGAVLATQYQQFRERMLMAIGACAVIALVWVAVVMKTTPNPLSRYTAYFGLGLTVIAGVLVFRARTVPPVGGMLAVLAAMPLFSVLTHWEENEQRGHLFGYWFGHDMFTPPFEWRDGPKKGQPIYPKMHEHTVLYGGTDPGRFNPTYMIFCESFIPPQKRRDKEFDRRDVYLITQNALADGTYLSYIRAHYNRSAQIDPPFFQELLRGPKELEQNLKTNAIARMMIPIDRFFLKLGDNIEKKRRAGSSFFEEEHFTDVASFAAKLQGQQDPVSKYIAANLSDGTKKLLGQGGKNSDDLKEALATDLNKLLEKELIYETNRFAAVKLTDHVARFVQQNPQSHTRIRLNRLLLEAAYPKEISKSPGGVYPDREILTATNEDSQRCFQEYLADAQRRLDHDQRFPNEPKQIKPGEDVRVVQNRVQVSGQVAVMAINGLLTKVIFDKNPDHEFYVEESFPLDWMYPHLTPYGIIMRINRQPVPELTEEMVAQDHEFWSQFSDRLIGNWITYDTPVSNICAFAEKAYLQRDYKGFKGKPEFVRDNDGQKAFSKLRSSIAGVYAWRVTHPKSPEEQKRMVKEADFAFKQAFAFCPYSPEAVFRYINLLISLGRVEDARLIANTAFKLDKNNGQLENLVNELERIRGQAGLVPQGLPTPADTLNMAYKQITDLIQAQQRDQALEALNQLLNNPAAEPNTFLFAANMYNQLGQMGKVEEALARLVKLVPDNPEAWFDLAGIQAIQSKSNEAIVSLRSSLQYSATRLAKDSNSPNLYSNALTDTRFQGVREMAEFKKLLTEMRPKG